MRYFTSFRPGQSFDYARRAVQAGLTGFEATYRESYFSPEVHQDYVDCLQRIKDELRVDFTMHAPINDINLGSLNRKVRDVAIEEIKESLNFAKTLGASLVVIHPAPGITAMPEGKWLKEEYPLNRQEGDVASQIELMVRAVKDLADLAPDLLICLENLVFPHELYRSPEEMGELIKMINRTNVGLTLDVGHAMVCGHKPADFLNLLSDHIFHVHLHDNDGVVDQHLPLGKGTIDYVGVIQSLRKLDYSGVVNLEFSLTNPDRYEEFLHQFE